MCQGRIGRQTSERAWTLPRTMGKPEETAKWQNRKCQEQGRQGQATLSIDPKNCRATVKAPSHMKTVSTKANSS